MTDTTPQADLTVDNASITFTMKVSNAGTVQDVIDFAALTLMRGGLDGINLLVTDEDIPGRSWVAFDGDIVTFEQAEERFKEMLDRDQQQHPDGE